MAGLLWWVQVVGGTLSIILVGGAIMSTIYSLIRGSPSILRQITGLNAVEDKLDEVHDDQKVSQQLQLQQARAFNDLSGVVCDEHAIPPDERPAKMNTRAIESDLMGRGEHDFTRDND